MNKKNYTVTVAISAFNEESNVEKFIKSVLNQKEIGFKITNIWIYDDGSTDNTVINAKRVKDNRIKIFSDGKRIGKSSRLNQIYKNLTTDFLVQSDSDIYFKHSKVISDILTPMFDDIDVCMCGGHPEPVPGKTFTERAINITYNAHAPMRALVREGHNPLSADGRLLAFRNNLVKKIIVPIDMISNDVYTYFCCLSNGYKYAYAPNAKVIFRSPTNIRDQIRQNTRFLSTEARMKRHFDLKLVEFESKIPSSLLIKSVLKQFLLHPILSSYIFIINRYCQIRSMLIEKKLTAKWAIAVSSKNFK